MRSGDSPVEIALVQVNFTYGRNAFLPYSVAALQAAVEARDRLRGSVRFLPTILLRDDLTASASLCSRADVVGVSCYVWNWEFSKKLASEIKKKSPSTVVIAGGPHIPHNDLDALTVLTQFDAFCIGEGETSFIEFLEHLVAGGQVPDCHVAGIAVRSGDSIRVNPPRAREMDLGALPSPYLSGVLDEVVERYPHLAFQASQETHRGCPYSCTFCDWGSATMQKVRRFPRERIVGEYGWMANKQIEVLYNCDANYGLFGDDEELTEALVSVSGRSGYPQKFRAAYAKNSNDRVFRIAELLANAGMSKGVTLSLQSLDEDTLGAIKRKNMQLNRFEDLVSQYGEAGIPTYTEIILGLPEETLTSFKSGINRVFEAGQHDGLNIYPAMVLPNAALNDEAYRVAHGIESVQTPLLLSHGSELSDGPIEFYELVVATRNLPKEDWADGMVFGWIVQALHCMNLTQIIARVAQKELGLSYSEFYSRLIQYAPSDSVLGRQVEQLVGLARDVSNGIGSLDLGDRSFGQIVWPVEEIAFLRLLKAGFADEVEELLLLCFPEMAHLQLTPLVALQRLSLRQPFLLEYDSVALPRTYAAAILGDATTDDGGQIALSVVREPLSTDWEEYAREVVWYGRKGSSMMWPICVDVRGLV